MLGFKGPLDRAFDAILGHEVRKLNRHLPRQRLALSELLKGTDPTVEAVDGSTILLNTSELQELAKVVPKEYQERVRLPIVILRRMDLGKSVYAVSGDRIEEFAVKRILGITDLDFRHMYMDKEMGFLYRPQVSELIRRFHSLFVIGFGLPKELADYGLKRD